MLGVVAWLVIRLSSSSAAGRAINTIAAIPSRVPAELAHSSSAGWFVTSVTSRPTKAGTMLSNTAVNMPAASNASTRKRDWRMKCQ